MPTVSAYAKILGNGFTHYVTKPSVTIGRSRKGGGGPDIGLGEGKRISREHAKIAFNRSSGRFEIICTSTNGMYVDGRFLSCYYLPLPLDNGTLIQIADKLFYFLLPNNLSGNGSLEGVTLSLNSGPPRKWTLAERQSLHTAVLTHGFDSWKSLHKSCPSRSLDEVKQFSLKFVAAVAHYAGVSDPKLVSNLSAMLTAAYPTGSAKNSPLIPVLKDWPELRTSAMAWARRIWLVNEIRSAVQTYGENAVLDGITKIEGRAPAEWWGRDEDADLLRGIFRHGFGNVEAIKSDPKLSFSKKKTDSKTSEPNTPTSETKSVLKVKTEPKVKSEPKAASEASNQVDNERGALKWSAELIGKRLEAILSALKLRNAKYSRKSRRRRQPIPGSDGKKRPFEIPSEYNPSSKNGAKRVKLA